MVIFSTSKQTTLTRLTGVNSPRKVSQILFTERGVKSLQSAADSLRGLLYVIAKRGLMRDGDDAEIRDHRVVMLKVNGFWFSWTSQFVLPDLPESVHM